MPFKSIFIVGVLTIFFYTELHAQDFITRVKIEFEKKVNMHGSIRSENADEYKKMIPKYDITYYDFLYAGGQSLYSFNREKNESTEDDFKIQHNKNSIFIDYFNKNTVAKKTFFEEDYIIKDTLKSVRWKITNETRTIAGYECRKAIGRIYDTVYIIAFYCEQLVMKAGPESINGLPGMILGMAIPRYNTTWFATKVELANINEASITPPDKGKKLTTKELTDLFIKKYKEYGVVNITTEKVKEQFLGYFLW